jgi:acyl-CoA thioesterase I
MGSVDNLPMSPAAAKALRGELFVSGKGRLQKIWRGVLQAIAVGACGALVFGIPFAEARPHVPTIVVFGDSFTAGLGIPHAAAFPAQLETWLGLHGKAARVINAGKSGDTTANALPRLDNALAERPDIVILELGANDALRGVDPSVTKRNLGAMMTRIQTGGAKILLTGILAPPNWGEEYQQAFDRVYPELARSYKVPLYPFFLRGVALDPALNQPDGLHPNERGVKAIVNRIAPVVVRLFLDEPALVPPR